MLYLLQALSGWSAAALALGLCVGFFTFDAERRGSWRRFAIPVALFLIGGGVAAFLRLLPGRYGFWLETALLLTMAYLIGCLVGSLARSLSGGKSAEREKAPASPLPAAPPAPLPAAAAAPTEGLAGPEPASQPMDEALAESVKTLEEQAKALAAATPAALAASQAAQDDPAQDDRAQSSAGSAPPAALPPAPAEALDDLRLIHGIDDQRAQKLHDLGIWRFGQIADWTPEQQKWIGDRLGGFGPAARAFCVAQARLLANGVETEFSRAVQRGEARPEALDDGAAQALQLALPQIIEPHVHDEIYLGARPLSLLQPPLGERDDLARISAIDPPLAARLNALGIWTYGQIARWSDENAMWIGAYLAFPGRIESENWIGQARAFDRTRTGQV